MRGVVGLTHLDVCVESRWFVWLFRRKWCYFWKVWVDNVKNNVWMVRRSHWRESSQSVYEEMKDCSVLELSCFLDHILVQFVMDFLSRFCKEDAVRVRGTKLDKEKDNECLISLYFSCMN